MKTIIILFGLSISSISLFAQSVVRSEIIGRPTTTSIMISISFDQDVYARVKYGTSAFIRDQAIAWRQAKKLEPLEMVIEGLKASQEYSYVVEYVKDRKSVV